MGVRSLGNSALAGRWRAVQRSAVAALAFALMCGDGRADDWSARVEQAQAALAERGVTVHAAWTHFSQGLVRGNGSHDQEQGGKFEASVRFDGERLGLWPGLFLDVDGELVYGESANDQGDATVLPVNTALAYPRQTGTDANVSVVLTQALNERAAIRVGKFNILRSIERTPLVAGGGTVGFQHVGIAAPVTGVTPPYILGGNILLQTDPVLFSFFLYDPRDASDWEVIEDPFADGITFSALARAPLEIAGRRSIHTVRGVFSTQDGLDFSSVPLPAPPPGVPVGEGSGYLFAFYNFQQYLRQDPDNPDRGWGVFGQVALSDGDPNPVKASAILGLGGDVPLATRANDRWGVAGFYYKVSQSFQDDLARIGLPIRDEYGIEAFYDFALGEHVTIGANAQVIRPALYGDDWVAYAGLKGRVSF